MRNHWLNQQEMTFKELHPLEKQNTGYVFFNVFRVGCDVGRVYISLADHKLYVCVPSKIKEELREASQKQLLLDRVISEWSYCPLSPEKWTYCECCCVKGVWVRKSELRQSS